jgi:hypothetical protein
MECWSSNGWAQCRIGFQPVFGVQGAMHPNGILL